MIELGIQVGLQFGEMADCMVTGVNWQRGYRLVVEVMTRQDLRQWPKSKRSCRAVPLPAVVMDGMQSLMAGRARDSLVFTAPKGGPVIKDAGIRRYPPHTMRHTAASWLVQGGETGSWQGPLLYFCCCTRLGALTI